MIYEYMQYAILAAVFLLTTIVVFATVFLMIFGVLLAIIFQMPKLIKKYLYNRRSGFGRLQSIKIALEWVI